MRLSDIKPRNKKKTTLIVILTLFVCLGGGLAFLFFPHLLNKKSLINVQYFENAKGPRIVTLYQEIGNSEDYGTYLTGYWLYLLDPVTNKELAKLFIKRRDKNNNVPTNPDMYCINNKEIWLVGDKGMYQGDKGFLVVVNMNNDQLEIAPTDFLNGWDINGKYNWYNTLTVVNEFNETACLDMVNHKVVVPSCTYPEEATTRPKSCFFFLKNTASSTRSHLYFYKSSIELPEPGIFTGFTQEGQVIPGWHLIDHVTMQRGFVMKPDLDAYVAQFDTSEKVTTVYNKEFFNNPSIIFSNDDVCILTANGDNGPINYFYQFNSTGKLIWKVECPKVKDQTFGYGFNCIYKKQETIISHSMNWIISIDNNSGKINWQCPK